MGSKWGAGKARRLSIVKYYVKEEQRGRRPISPPVASAHRRVVRVTPSLLNERSVFCSVTAAYCGRDGRWPPYLRGDDGFVKVLLALMRGMVQTSEALRAARADEQNKLFLTGDPRGIYGDYHPEIYPTG